MRRLIFSRRLIWGLILGISFWHLNGDLSAQPIRLGLRGGMNISSIDGDFASRLGSTQDSFSSRSLYDVHLGLVLRIKLLSLAIQPELIYSRQGGEIKVRSGFSGGSEQIRLGYIAVPVLAKYYPIPLLKFNIFLGPQFSILIDKSTRVRYQNPESFDATVSLENQDNFKEPIEDYDLGGCIGIGFDSPINVSLDARYSRSFAPLQGDTEEGSGAFNQVVQLSLLYYF
ncbi:MAG: porin family protein [Cytophagales bacterium]|nr:porin family protein [Cytophagales bacterium]